MPLLLLRQLPIQLLQRILRILQFTFQVGFAIGQLRHSIQLRQRHESDRAPEPILANATGGKQNAKAEVKRSLHWGEVTDISE